jgi:hypothetical protein
MPSFVHLFTFDFLKAPPMSDALQLALLELKTFKKLECTKTVLALPQPIDGIDGAHHQ